MRQRLMQILSSDETSHDASIDAAVSRFWGRKPKYLRESPRQPEGARVIDLARWTGKGSARTPSFTAR